MFDLTLTFDNGPDPVVTPLVLALLAKKKILSTFFVLGKKIKSPDGLALAQAAYDQGHWIGNHSMQHQLPLGEAQDAAAAAHMEIIGTQQLLGPLAQPQRLFRPFGRGGLIGPHLLSTPALELLQSGGYTLVLWNAIPRDWADPDGWVETALQQCQSQPHSLMVLHDLPTGAMQHLERFLDLARQAGARFRQDFPPECVPIVGGNIVAPVDHLVNTGA